MKNLAKCKPREFLAQTVKIKRAAERWLKATDLVAIWRTKATTTPITDEMDEETKKSTLRANHEARTEQIWGNLSRVFDAVAEEHPGETLELLALACFVEPEKVDDYPIDEYMAALTEMINNESVKGFFISLLRLGQTAI